MGQHVRVGVAQQALLKGHLYPAQYQLPALYQPVHVVASAHAHGFRLLSQSSPGRHAVLRGGEFQVPVIPGGELHPAARRLDKLAVVGVAQARGLGLPGGVEVHLPLEGLGRLNGHQSVPGRGGFHKALAVR